MSQFTLSVASEDGLHWYASDDQFNRYGEGTTPIAAVQDWASVMTEYVTFLRDNSHRLGSGPSRHYKIVESWEQEER